VGVDALLRAIELNQVGVDNNKLAFSLGRLAAADPLAVDALLQEPQAAPASMEESLDAIVSRGLRHLTGYQDAAYARRYADFVARVRVREASLGADQSLPFTRAVARSLLKLMAFKDEYEVARLYTDGEFLRSLQQQFEGDAELEFYMAPPVLSRAKAGERPRKIRLGGWMLPAMRVLALGKRLRGGPFDVFGYSQERRLERSLIREYRARIQALLPALTADKLQLATEIAAVPLSIRGFGPVKLANLRGARVREAELLHRFDPATYPRPAQDKVAGQFRGIAVTAAAH
jgi:indolepyruvate ferredoxin oxidoreductase